MDSKLGVAILMNFEQVAFVLVNEDDCSLHKF